MIRSLSTLALAGVLLSSAASAQHEKPHRAPAVPLVAHTPYFSVWSTSDRPTDDWSRHWTGKIQAMSGMVRVDGTAYRVLGPEPRAAAAMTMTDLKVMPLRTLYTFEGGGVRVALNFTTPTIPGDLELVSRPVTYVTYEVRSADGKPHEVSVYFDATGEWAVNSPEQSVEGERRDLGGLGVMSLGMSRPKVLGRSGDDLRIEWGRFFVASPAEEGRGEMFLTSDRAARDGFARDGKIGADAEHSFPRPVRDAWPVMAVRRDLGTVGASESKAAHLLLAYDEVASIEYFGAKLKPYWARGGRTIDQLLKTAESEYEPLSKKSREYDAALMADLEEVGGSDYARLCALAFRQCLAAHGYAEGTDGKLVMMSKENFSNGCIDTVDVTYPAAPFFLFFNVDLLKAQVTPVLDYARSPRWKFPFAPHDLGQYPLANGQVYGGGEQTEKDQMPVEECGNMLLLVAAICKADGRADYAKAHWPVLTKWAEYLIAKGLDPENQLCTDDFAGHLAHNTNLSLKAIVALGGYAQMCESLGKKDEARSYREKAGAMAARWVKMADDGDHYRLAFDKPGTWSQKYNLVWDKLLGLGLFPPEVARKEVAFGLSHQCAYGLPLDNRSLYTKLDWIVWTATMADSRADFQAFIAPLIRFAEASPSRVPLTDWYWTHDAKQQGFQARSVVGGVFIKMLDGRDWTKPWAPAVGR